MGIEMTSRDAANVREMFDWYKKQIEGGPARENQSDTIFPPEVYFAKPQSASGIPAKSEDDDEPGSGPCDIYKLDNSDPPALVAVSGFEKTVYNFGETPIGQDWITIVRSKYGKWTPAYTSDSQVVFGKMDEEMAEGETKTMSVWAGNPLADTGENLEVTDWLLGSGETIGSGKKVSCEKYHGVWYPKAAECP